MRLPADENDLEIERPKGDRYLFHYTTAISLANIVDSGKFRFSSIDRMNDPRESKPWDTLPREVDSILRRVQLACMTQEGSEHKVPDGMFERGFGRSRSWSQYAGEHRGAVLWFDAASFGAAVRRAVADLPGGEGRFPALRDGPVSYLDIQNNAVVGPSGKAPDYTAMIAINPAGFDPAGALGAAELLEEEHWKSIFFRKNEDWSSEREYRFVVRTSMPTAFEVPIADSLRAIVLGSEFPSTEASVIQYRLEQVGLDVTLLGMKWPAGGTPAAFPWPFA